MKPSIIKSKDELPMFMSVMDLIDLLGISRSSAYELAAEEGSLHRAKPCFMFHAP